jgi:hypothetical protein
MWMLAPRNKLGMSVVELGTTTYGLLRKRLCDTILLNGERWGITNKLVARGRRS